MSGILVGGMGEAKESLSERLDEPPVLRIFLSSPGDVAEERNEALGVIRRVQGWFQGRVVLVPVLWEHEPLLATAGFQEQIDGRRPPSRTDVAVFILWARLGFPLSSQFALEDGRRPTGTEWEFEDARRAAVERQAPRILVYRKSIEPSVSIKDPRRRERESQYEAVERFFTTHFRDARDLSFCGACHSYPNTYEFATRFESHLTALLEDLLGSGEVVSVRDCPFRGLEAFEAEHAPIYFGRSRARHEVLAALRRQAADGRAFLLITGASGSGKSSLARAGILPQLTYPGAVETSIEGGLCRRAVLRPSDRRTPLESFAVALATPGALPEIQAAGTADELARIFAESASAAVSAVRASLARAAKDHAAARKLDEPPPIRLVLLVDQFEEVFTREGVTDRDRTAFFTVLDALARSGHVWVLATLRSHFYPRLAEHPELMALKAGAGQYDLLRPDAPEIGDIVRWPARVAGLRYERDASGTGLDERIITEAVEGGRDTLPLLEYALRELYERREGNLLTWRAFRDLGGIEGAVRGRADAEWALLPAEAQRAFPKVLRELVEVPEGIEVTAASRRARSADLTRTTGAEALIESFCAARLLVLEGEGGETIVRVAHEALLRTWPRATERIQAEAELLRIQTRIRSQAVRWKHEARLTSLLLAEGKPLEEGRLLKAAGFDLDPDVAAFLTASELRARRVQLVRKVAVGTIALLAVVSASMLVVVSHERDKARALATRETKARLEAQSARTRTEEVSRVLEVMDDLPGALEAYRLGLASAEARLEEDPDDDRLLSDVSGMQRRVGRALEAQEDLEGASSAYLRALEIDEQLAAAVPDDPDRQAALADSYSRLANVVDDYPTELRSLKKCLSLREHLLEGAPDDPHRLREVAVALASLGYVLQENGDHSEALAEYRAALSRTQRGLDLAPRDPGRMSDHAYMQTRVSGLELLTGARPPTSPAEHLALADKLRESGDYPESVEHYAQALEDPSLSAAALYNAACAAALAAQSLGGSEAASYIRLSLDWLKEDITLRRNLVSKAKSLLVGEENAALLFDHCASLSTHVDWARTADPDLAALRGLPEFETLFENRGPR